MDWRLVTYIVEQLGISRLASSTCDGWRLLLVGSLCQGSHYYSKFLDSQRPSSKHLHFLVFLHLAYGWEYDVVLLTTPYTATHSINVLWIDQVPCNSSHWSDVLQVYATWCGHCRDLEPEYNHLAEVLQDIPSIVIAKMDGTKNEHSLVEVSYFFQLSHHPSHSWSNLSH